MYIFRFNLPESNLPCSFESKPCCIRYYIKVTVDVPYASPPQGMKYFTVIGPHIDCMDEQYLVQLDKPSCFKCCVLFVLWCMLLGSHTEREKRNWTNCYVLTTFCPFVYEVSNVVKWIRSKESYLDDMFVVIFSLFPMASVKYSGFHKKLGQVV